jgi:adenine-specific DNA-methyltransferase
MKTQGIRYSGSKKEILPKIIGLIPDGCKKILDGCSGTTRVAQAFKKSGFDIDCNDLAEYSKQFGLCYIKNNELNFLDLISHLNNLPPVTGWLTENYAGEENNGCSEFLGKKRNWVRKNTEKADSIREEIEKLNLSECGKSVALTSLILALDKVSNNLGHQAAYLRNWAPRCFLDLKLEVPELIAGNGEYNVFQQDIDAVKKEYDLVYLDIPYGTNNEKHTTTRVRYNSYYHIWISLCKWDKPELFGVSNRRKDSSDKFVGALSQFEKLNYDDVRSSIKKTCEGLNSKYIMFSYNNKSKIKIPDLLDVFKAIGETSYIEFSHKENIQKRLTLNNLYLGDQSKNLEYLFLIKK